ncbi:MAG TPA: hypothetical protein PKB08_12185 [Burkholderiaceae bacterium]|nr:hypothetical protein [Burkholderiaceae bacterium]
MRRGAGSRVLGPAARLAVLALAVSLAGCSVSIGIGVGDDAMIDTGTATTATASGFDTLVALSGPGIGIADDPLRVPPGEHPRRALAPGSFDWLEIAAPLRAAAVPVSGGRYSSLQTLACDSGSVQLRAVFANSAAFSVGDTIELDTTGCRFGSVRFTGTMAMSVGSASGYPGLSAAWSARITIDYTAWRTETTTLPAQARVVTGRAVLDGQRLDALNAIVEFDSAQLSIDPVVSGVARARQSVELLTLRLVDGPSDDTVGIDFELADGRFAGTDLARLRARSHGVVTLPGPVPAYPLDILLVSAPDDSAVYADAIDATKIRLDLDRFLDGVIDATLSTSWSSLRGLI